jgi:tripartite-type tricarboxylate transporter receptor subunit TctC
LIAGQVDFILDTGSLGHVQGGNLKALAVASAKRIPALPYVPTFAELGYKDMIASAWYRVLAPAGLPKPFQDKLNTAVNAVLKDSEVRKQIEMKLGGVVSDGESPA